MASLAEEYPKQQARVRAMRDRYLALDGGAGAPAAAMMERDLKEAEEAAASGDVVRMLTAYSRLAEWADG